ncbi:RHS repeat-associated core domain-containing protein, partial [Neisseria sp. 83E34]|uniref:RHS repeat-associated core domain-containing protein n=1 Tax=Neisseria sp. 83E34 TaxID=1692264 RepID=UPI000AB371D1
TQEENARNGLIATDWRDPQYDMLFQPVTNSIRYHYDFNGNRTATVLPDGRQINYLYYGSGHLHQINLDGEVITDIERDKLHREIQRTQGALTSRYELDPLGRLKAQIAQLNSLSENGKGKSKVAAGYIPARMHGQTAVKRSYGYDKTGNLLHSTDQRTGTTHFEYDKLGRITRAGNERFAFDPAHNILSDRHRDNAVKDNRLKEYNGTSYYYDGLGNLIHRELPDGEVQNYFYDLHDQLVKVEIFKKDGNKETWIYHYDALGRRIGKGRLKKENANEVSDRHSTDHTCLKTQGGKDILDSEIAFLWDGSHLLQETHSDSLYTYIYTDQDSYEPLAQIRDWTNEEEPKQSIHYFHCDQIGIPREMTDRNGNLLWFGDYYGWGKLKSETNITNAHQPFRLQNQYCDKETGLHYNFFRYYEPDCGRFVNQDPIRLWGGNNLYQFSTNIQNMMDPLGLNAAVGVARGVLSFIAVDTMTPEPTDAAWPKWAVYAVAGGVAAGVVALSESDTCTGRCEEEKKRKKRCKKWGQGTPAQAESIVKKGRGPKGIKRIDRPELSVPGSQYHAHAHNNAALNLDGTIHDKHRGMPPFSKDDKDFLFCYGWKGV